MKTSSRSSHDNSAFSSAKHSHNNHNHKRHNSDISLSTIAEETHSTASLAESQSVSSCEEQYNGTSVFIEPHITVETSTLPALTSSTGSSRSSSPAQGAAGKVTKVTATAKFKVELHHQTPLEGSSRPSSRRSRRSSSSSKGGESSVQSSLEIPSNSLASSLSSDGGFSEK